MIPELETLIGADEEARVRVEAAQEDALGKIEAARAERDRLLGERKKDAEANLAGEIEALREEGEKLVEERRRRREQLLGARRADADARLELAANAYEEILRDGPPWSVR